MRKGFNLKEKPFLQDFYFTTKIAGFLFSNEDFFSYVERNFLPEASNILNGNNDNTLIGKSSLWNKNKFSFEKEYIIQNLLDLQSFIATKAYNYNYFISLSYLFIKYDILEELDNDTKQKFIDIIKININKVKEKIRKLNNNYRPKNIYVNASIKKKKEFGVFVNYNNFKCDELAYFKFIYARDNLLLYYFMNNIENDENLYFSFVDFIKIENKHFEIYTTNYRIQSIGAKKYGKYINDILDPNIFKMLFLKVIKKTRGNFNSLKFLKIDSLFLQKLHDFKKLGVVYKDSNYRYLNDYILEDDKEIVLTSLNGSKGFKFTNQESNFVVITEDDVIYNFERDKKIPLYVTINNITYDFVKPNSVEISEKDRKWGNVNNVILFNKKNENVINLVTLKKNNNIYIYLKFNINLEETDFWGKTSSLINKVKDQFEELFLIRKGVPIISDEKKLVSMLYFYSSIGNYDCCKILFNMLLSVALNNENVYKYLFDFAIKNNTPDTCYYAGRLLVNKQNSNIDIRNLLKQIKISDITITKPLDLYENRKSICKDELNHTMILGFDVVVNQFIEKNNIKIDDYRQELNLSFDDLEKKLLRIMEHYFGFELKEEQLKLINKLKNKNDFFVEELLMGKGKSSVITPALCLISVFKQERNAVIVIPSHLLNQMVDEFSSYLYFLGYCDISIINVRKYVSEYNKNKINNNGFHWQYVPGVNTTGRKFIFITDPVSLQFVELNGGLSERERYEANFDSLDRNIYQNTINSNKFKYGIIKFRDLIFRRSNFIVDEIDSIYNYSSNTLNITDEERSDESGKNIDLGKIIDKVLEKKNEIFNIVNNNNQVEDKNENKEPFEKTYFEHTFESKYKKAINFLKTKHYNKDYGRGDLKSEFRENNHYLAIPYKATNAPINGSEFSDIILVIVLTIACYYKEGLNKNDLKKISKTNDIMENIKLYELTRVFNEALNFGLNLNIKIIIDFYVKNVLVKYLSSYETRNNISTLDILNRNIIEDPIIFVGYTGTANFKIPEIDGNKSIYISDVNKDNEKEKYMNYLFGKMVDRNQIVKFDIHNMRFKETNNYFDNEQFQDLIANNQVFIDAGSYMLGKTDEYVADKILKILGERDIRRINKVIYFKEGIPVVFDRNKNINPLPNKSMNNQKDYYLYFSQQYCVGSDIKQQPNDLRGFITIANNNTSVEIFQAMFRLRLLKNEAENSEKQQEIRCLINFDLEELTGGGLLEHLEKNFASVSNGKLIYLYLQMLKVFKRQEELSQDRFIQERNIFTKNRYFEKNFELIFYNYNNSTKVTKDVYKEKAYTQLKKIKYLQDFCSRNSNQICEKLGEEITKLLEEEIEVENEVQQQQQQQELSTEQNTEIENLFRDEINSRNYSLSIGSMLDFNNYIFNPPYEVKSFTIDENTEVKLRLTPKFYFSFKYSKINYSYFILKKNDINNRYILLESEDYAVIKSYFDRNSWKASNYTILSSHVIGTLSTPSTKIQKFENLLRLCLQRNSLDTNCIAIYGRLQYFNDIKLWMKTFKIEIENKSVYNLESFKEAREEAKRQEQKEMKRLKEEKKKRDEENKKREQEEAKRREQEQKLEKERKIVENLRQEHGNFKKKIGKIIDNLKGISYIDETFINEIKVINKLQKNIIIDEDNDFELVNDIQLRKLVKEKEIILNIFAAIKTKLGSNDFEINENNKSLLQEFKEKINQLLIWFTNKNLLNFHIFIKSFLEEKEIIIDINTILTNIKINDNNVIIENKNKIIEKYINLSKGILNEYKSKIKDIDITEIQINANIDDFDTESIAFFKLIKILKDNLYIIKKLKQKANDIDNMVNNKVSEKIMLNIKSANENCQELNKNELSSNNYDIYLGIKYNDNIYLTKKLKEESNNEIINKLDFKILKCAKK